MAKLEASTRAIQGRGAEGDELDGDTDDGEPDRPPHCNRRRLLAQEQHAEQQY